MLMSVCFVFEKIGDAGSSARDYLLLMLDVHCVCVLDGELYQ